MRQSHILTLCGGPDEFVQGGRFYTSATTAFTTIDAKQSHIRECSSSLLKLHTGKSQIWNGYRKETLHSPTLRSDLRVEEKTGVVGEGEGLVLLQEPKVGKIWFSLSAIGVTSHHQLAHRLCLGNPHICDGGIS